MILWSGAVGATVNLKEPFAWIRSQQRTRANLGYTRASAPRAWGAEWVSHNGHGEHRI